MSVQPAMTQISSNPSEEKLSYSQIIDRKISKLLVEAQILYENNEYSKAVNKLSRAIALQPLNSDLFERRAEVYITLRNYDLAIANLQKILSLKEDNEAVFKRLGQVHCLHGEALYDEGRYGQALEVYEQAAQYRHGDKSIVMKRIWCLLSLKRYEVCVEMIKKELEVDQSDPELYALRAQLKLMFGDTSAAYYDVCSALTFDPCHSKALSMKAGLEESAVKCRSQAVHHSLVGRKLDALKKISTAIESDPVVAEYHIFRGALYRRLKDFQAAVDDFLTAMDKVCHQQDSDVYQNASKQLVLTYNDFAMECFRQRHFNEAVLLLNRAIKEEKKEKGLYLNRGDCFYRLNNLPFALADYHQALELDPSNWDVCCRIGIVCCEMGVECYEREQFAKAETHFTTAIGHNPKVSRFYVCRAKARFAQKNIPGTNEDLITALTLEPHNEECVSLIARAFPGKSPDDLLSTQEAEQCKQQLDRTMHVLSSRIQNTANPNHFCSNTVTKLLDELNLKFEETSGTCSTMKDSSTELIRAPMDVESLMSEDTIGSEGGSIAPRDWTVLSHPLPELTSDPQGVMPILKDCLQEHSFHKKIYYSKKNATDEVKRVLRNPPALTTPVKLDH